MSILDLFLHDLAQAKKKRAEGVDVEAAKKNSEKLSPKERQALMSRKCSVPRCNTGNFRMTDYCHKHQDHISSNSESNPEPNDEENWWEDEKD